MTFTDKLIQNINDNKNTRYISRYASLSNAMSARSHNVDVTTRRTPIVLGDDGKFWVCRNNRVAYTLEKLGYEFA